MSLVLGAGAYCNWNEALPVLTALGFNEGQARAASSQLTQALANQHSAVFENMTELRVLSDELESYPNQRVVLFYSDLADALVHAINSEQNVIDSIQDWKKSLTVLQELYRKHRKQALLFNLQEVLARPQLFLEVCTKEWDYVVDTPDISLEVKPAESWSKLLAEQILVHDDELNQVLQHTKAMTWPLDVSDELELDNEAGVLALLKQLQFSVAAQKQCAQLATERTSLNLTLGELNTLLKEAQNQTELTYKSFTQQKTNNKELAQENQLVLDELFVVQEELEKRILEVQKNQQELDSFHESSKQLEAEKSNLNKSVTDLKNQLKESQGRLAKQALESQKERQDINSLRESSRQLEAEKDNLNRVVRDLQHQLKNSRAQIGSLQTEKERLSLESLSTIEQLTGIEAELEKQIFEVQARRLSS